MDVVICVAYKDCFFLKKNIQFIEKNLNPENIYIITNVQNFFLLENSSSRLKLLDENKLIDGLNFAIVRKALLEHMGLNMAGWYFQQFLKMAFSLTEYANKYYLVWDSDTVPLNHIDFLSPEGKYYFMPKTEHNDAYFTTIDNLFEAPRKADYSFISEHMVFDVQIMKELINTIANSTVKDCSQDAPWFVKAIYANTAKHIQGFSEFETYGTYCLNYHPNSFELRTFRTFRRGGLIYGMLASVEEIESLKNDLDTCSFELYDYPVSLHRKMIQLCFYWYCRLRNKFRRK